MYRVLLLAMARVRSLLVNSSISLALSHSSAEGNKIVRSCLDLFQTSTERSADHTLSLSTAQLNQAMVKETEPLASIQVSSLHSYT